jgi:hypothetical protein
MITYVTAFYKLDERKYCTVNDYLRYFLFIVNTGVHIHLFLQPSLYEEYISFIGERDNVHITLLDFEELPIYKQLKGIDIPLPKYRNPEKDTRNYMILINSKTEFIKRAIENNIYNTTHFAWIDFGIKKVIQNPSVFGRLADVDKIEIKDTCLVIAAIHRQNNINLCRVDNVCWRFAGGFFLGDSNSLVNFHNLYETHFCKLVRDTNVLTWEVNIWAMFEYLDLFRPSVYISDHNDTILENIII